jgi:uncharacterized small protein (DUF1192 family)
MLAQAGLPGKTAALHLRQRRLPMIDDEDRKHPKTHDVGMPLDTLSIEELEARITLLDGEIARLRTAIAAKGQSRSAADAVFKF